MSGGEHDVVGVIVPGVTGRMGAHIGRAALEDPRHTLAAATAREGRSEVGHDAGPILGRGEIGVTVRGSVAQAAEEAAGTSVIIDFTSPPVTLAVALEAQRKGLPIVVGTTGLDDDATAALQKAAESVPVLIAPNTSLGANLLAALTRLATKALVDAGTEADAEIVELHHNKKRDAPSGTALLLGRAVADARGVSLDDVGVRGRAGEARRGPDDIGLSAVRGGTVPGEHTVYLFLDDERVELTHRVTDRRIFALGALTAARFVAGQPPGTYTMDDVLGLPS